MGDQNGNSRNDDQYTIRTRSYNEKPELMGLECKKCGGVLELTDRTHAVCPYCGQRYLIDEAKGTVINIQVDYTGDNEMRRAVNSARNALLIFLAVAAVLAVIILGFNIAAKKIRIFHIGFRYSGGCQRAAAGDLLSGYFRKGLQGYWGRGTGKYPLYPMFL